MMSGVYRHSFHNAKQSGNSGQHKIQITETGAAKADVAVHVRRRIVQIQRERPGVGTIVPIAATDEGSTVLIDIIPLHFCKNA